VPNDPAGNKETLVGRTLAHYRVVSRLGAGAMGEVYRATDSRLARDVAIKVLPSDVARDAERLERFEREAKVLASLNHPNIAAIYGFENAQEPPFLAMELVEGEDLAARLRRGPLTVDEALEAARQIAEALEEAHDKGIVHRDLKPANVKVTAEGKVKVLDFGLAKAWAMDAASGPPADVSDSPTRTHSGTQAGMILGTPAYMAPEQARGTRVDRRADIWAFGALLWEMLTGRVLFSGGTLSDVMAAVLTRDPDWSALPAGTPPPVRRLLRRCLERDVRRRLQAIGEARLMLEDPGSGETEGRPSSTRWRWAWAAAGLAGLALGGAGWLRPRTKPEGAPVRKVDLSIPDFGAGYGRPPILSPDGSRLAYVAGDRLLVRSLDRFDARDLVDARDISYTFWSPDGSHLAYVRQGRAWRIAAGGGDPVELGEVPQDLSGSGGGAWTADGLVFGGSDTVGLWEIPTAGGRGREILGLDPKEEADFHEVTALPDGRGVVFVVHRRASGADTIGLLAGGSRREILRLSGERIRNPAVSTTGHILYERETTNPGVWALPFSLSRLEAEGPPVLVVPGARLPSVSRDGTLAFVRSEEGPVSLVRVTRGGDVEDVAKLPRAFAPMLVPLFFGPGYRVGAALSLSPDGGRLALAIGFTQGLWVHDLGRGSLSQIAKDTFPGPALWMPAGDRIIYASGRGARAWNLSARRADAAGEETRIATSDEVQIPVARSPDGRWLVYREGAGAKGRLLKMPLNGSAPPSPLFASPVNGLAASFSPDGRWLAYEGDESTRTEVYVRPFPEGEGRFQVSTDGGESPIWSRSGEIFFRSRAGVEAVRVTAREGSFAVSKPTLLFRTGGESGLVAAFDASPDGRSFFLLRARVRDRVSFIFSWPRDLARLGEDSTAPRPPS